MSAAVITLIKKYMAFEYTIHALNYGKLVIKQLSDFIVVIT